MGRGSGTVLLILYDAQQCRVFFSSLSPSAYEFDNTDMRFHLRKSVVTSEKKISRLTEHSSDKNLASSKRLVQEN